MARKDTDPHGISASMKFVKQVATLDKDCFRSPFDWLLFLKNKARRIRKKFRKGEKS